MTAPSHGERSPLAPLEQGQRCYTLTSTWGDRAAAPGATVAPRSQFLCAALSGLATACYSAVGGGQRADEVAQAAALLALLTKVDDDVIDSLPFHGGWRTPRAVLERRTRAYLAPTLQSLYGCRPANQEARCLLAAEVGHRLRALAVDPARLGRLLYWIRQGWEIQVEAVSVLTGHPSCCSLRRVEQVSGAISGAWLLMITAVGTLPGDAGRGLSAAEEQAFFHWGDAIQRADALADLSKDIRDGHGCTVPGWQLWWSQGRRYLEAMEGRHVRAIRRMLARQLVDLTNLPGQGWVEHASGKLAGLGQVPRMLDWILGFLCWRYSVEQGAATATHPRVAACVAGRGADYQAYVSAVSQQLRARAGERQQGQACSER